MPLPLLPSALILPPQRQLSPPSVTADDTAGNFPLLSNTNWPLEVSHQLPFSS